MPAPAIEPEARFAVYLVDPGPRPAAVVALLQKLTDRPLDECAEMLQRSPALVALYQDREPAEDLLARCREFDALAIVRPADKPVKEVEPEPFSPAPAQRGLQIILAAMGVVQVGLGIYWLRLGWTLTGVGGVLFGLMVAGYYALRLRRREG